MSASHLSLFAAVFLLAACAGQAAPDGIPVLAGGSQSDVERESFREVHDEAGLTALLQEGFSRRASPPVIKVDFARQRLLAVFMGRQSHGGFGIQVAGVEELPDAVQVHVLFTAPGPNCATTQVINHPYAVFLLPASTKPLRYVAEHTVNDC